MNIDTKMILPTLDDLEEVLGRKGYDTICGVDEVGRGPLAGPVVAAAVLFPIGLTIDGLDDSKKMTPLQRERVFEKIINLGLVCSIGVIDNECIDKMNILRASLMAMRKAVMDLKRSPDFVLVDGNQTIPKLTYPQMAIVGGDGRYDSIAAASVIAKVTRDRMMDRMEGVYPSYSFSKHKGYPTAAHLAELREHGPCEIHRKSFKPVAEVMQEYALI